MQSLMLLSAYGGFLVASAWALDTHHTGLVIINIGFALLFRDRIKREDDYARQYKYK